MSSIRQSIQRYFAPIQPLPAGNYHYQSPPDLLKPYRLHLRQDADGSGILIVNASTILHLNATACEYAYHLVKGTPETEVARTISSRYRISRKISLQDFRDFSTRVHALIDTPDLDPVTYLDFERQVPYSEGISAPYRLDCALTYRLSPGTDQRAAPAERVKSELSTDQWKVILDKTWSVGIPHIIFTGGEATLREDLLELIKYTENNGQVSGLLTDGVRLAEPGYLDTLLQTGLDHLTLIFREGLENSWNTLDKLVAADIFLVVHNTINVHNAGEIPGLLSRLAEKGVQNVSLSARTPNLEEDLMKAREQVAALDLSLVWDIPVPYSDLNPVALEVAPEHQPKGAGHAWLYVEPDGDVLPAQDIIRPLGNFLTDTWETIWQSARQD